MDSTILLLTALICWMGPNCHVYAGNTTYANVSAKNDLVALSQVDSPVIESVEDPKCYNFTVAFPHYRQEFYSPGYPGNYPPKVDCFLLLKADPGFIIQLDFRDQFSMEPHQNCTHDFLEVRDGAHGYSKLMENRTFCGHDFPPVLTSTGRYLWLRFKSDDNIEYTGFKAVYQFLPDPAPRRPDQGACRFEVTGMDGTFGRADVPEEFLNHSRDYHVPLDCTWVVTVAENQRIQLSFPSYALVSPNECDLNYIEIFGEKTDLQHRLRHFCGSKIEIVLSKSHVLHLRLFAHHTALRSTFEALFTAVTLYRGTEATAKCVPSEFDCEDEVCIDSSLRCNGRINCKFRYDEENCKVVKTRVMSSDHIIIILTIFCVTLFGLCFSCLFNCIRKLRADHNVYQARRSRSREDRLDVFDDTSAKALSLHMATGVSSGPTKNKSRHPSGKGTATSTDDPEDTFQQRPRQQTSSTSRSASSPTTPNGFLDSCISIEQFTGAPAKQNGDRPYPGVLFGLAESSGRDSDEDDDVGGDEEEEDEVEMVDHACQTRESLFDRTHNTGSSATAVVGPSDQLPRQVYPRGPVVTAVQPRVQLLPQGDSRYKAERTIEIAQRSPPTTSSPAARLMFGKANTATSSSAASSKSGADVVILH